MPVAALSSFLALRRNGDGTLFCHRDASALTKYQFGVVTSRALSHLGLHGVYSCIHSFQIGASSMAAAMGFASGDIMRLGCWHSRFIDPTYACFEWFSG